MKVLTAIRGPALATVLLTATTIGCSTSGPIAGTGTSASSRTSVATTSTAANGSDTTSTTAARPPAQLAWQKCGARFECTEIEVPLDYGKVDGPTITIALNRRPASVPNERIGAILVNPGGPGASGKEFATQLLFPKEIRDRFDIIGFDPRGVGDSDGLNCHSHLQAIYDADPTIEDDRDRADLLDVSRDFVDECNSKYADLLAHLGTENVARDVDQIRVALGDQKINFLGYSYGTSIAQQYAKEFPTRVRALILDGVIDTSVDALTVATEQAAGFQQALAAFIKDCDSTGCLTGGARATIDDVVAAAERQPIPASRADRPATAGVVSLAMTYSLYSEVLWSNFADALDDAANGDGSGLVELADSYLQRGEDGSYNGMFEIYFAVSCLDSNWPSDPNAIFAAAERAAAESPDFGEATVNDYLRCALWPTPPQPLSPVPADTRGLPPIMVVSTTGDPATPYENGVRVADQIPGATLVTHRGEGHTVVMHGTSSCVDDLAVNYLLTVELPESEVTC